MEEKDKKIEEYCELDAICSPKFCDSITFEVAKHDLFSGTDSEIRCNTYNCTKKTPSFSEVKVRLWSFEEEEVLKEIMKEKAICDINCRIPAKQIGECFNKIMIDKRGSNYGIRSDSNIREKCASILRKQQGMVL